MCQVKLVELPNQSRKYEFKNCTAASCLDAVPLEIVNELFDERVLRTGG
jgi:hypothetical protein